MTEARTVLLRLDQLATLCRERANSRRVVGRSLFDAPILLPPHEPADVAHWHRWVLLANVTERAAADARVFLEGIGE